MKSETKHKHTPDISTEALEDGAVSAMAEALRGTMAIIEAYERRMIAAGDECWTHEYGAQMDAARAALARITGEVAP